MSLASLPYIPADGTLFDADQFNRDLYSNTTGESLYQTSNGYLDPTVNFNAAFLIKNEQIRPYMMSYGKSDGLLYSQDFIETAWGRSNTAREIGGTAITWYQRSDASLAMINLSFFCSWWRLRGRPIEGQQTDNDNSARIYYVVEYDGQEYAYTERDLPLTVYPTPYAYTGNITSYQIIEAFQARPINMHFPVKNISEGWHTATLKVSVRANNQVEQSTDGGIYEQPQAYYESNHRIRIRVRNATVLTVK
jgi:hypothetical protein